MNFYKFITCTSSEHNVKNILVTLPIISQVISLSRLKHIAKVVLTTT